MSRPLAPRQIMIWAGLALSVLATIWTSMAEDESTAQVSATTRPTPASPQFRQTTQPPKDADAMVLDMQKLKREPMTDLTHNLFSANTEKTQQALETQQAIAQQAVEIPPLPFTYAGKLEDNGQFTVFLSMGDKNYSVKTGDVVGEWKVRSIAPPKMILSYLPLRAEVPLMIGDSQ
ncbi:hypothetical protein LG201_01270 [Methylobacillus gramineus]|uniref:hypothetical protein n=1 Tax=Methylobacillus gramineus TaxID=755169 RepID=UPI001CFF662F|nr:hypothetical protein [Methylobacillus gramineus]MCB5183830.1 hypothetical protein [Methylobacillus gramineus]